MLAQVRAGGGVLSPRDLASYRVLQVPVTAAPFGPYRVLARSDLNETIRTIVALPSGFTPLELADALLVYGSQRLGDTTNISVVDATGNACVITMTLGIGAGVWLPGLGVHLNSMLGEGDLIRPGTLPGERMASCMCPTVVLDAAGGLVMAIGSAGATRIRTALIQTLTNVLVHGDDMTTAIRRPRFHPVSADGTRRVHVEPGCDPTPFADAGYAVQRWDRLDHYFGGVSAVGLAGAAGDPRRGGVGRLLQQH